MLIGCGLGAGAVVGGFWTRFDTAQQALRFVGRLNGVGVEAKIKRTETGDMLTITGPVVLHGTTWHKDSQGYVVGVDLLYPMEGGR